MSKCAILRSVPFFGADQFTFEGGLVFGLGKNVFSQAYNFDNCDRVFSPIFCTNIKLLSSCMIVLIQICLQDILEVLKSPPSKVK